MRRLNLIIFLLVFSSTFLLAQSNNYAGHWQGILKVGADLRLVFHIKQDASGSLSATADSPDQAAYGMKADSVYYSVDSIYISMKGIGARYTGKLLDDSTISGFFVQRASIPLELKRTTDETKKPENKRPQTPKAPFPYKAEQVEYDNSSKSLHYGGTLTIPDGKGPFPVALLITGSGKQDRDETLFGHKPFAVIADALTRNGIAVLRVDDRGAGKSTGIFEDATTADFAEDVMASLNFLKSRPEVNKKKIGMIGHSEGGMIAPIVVSKRKDIAFTILLAGPGIPIKDLMADQSMAIMASVGIPATAVNAYRPLYTSLVDAAIISSDTAKGIIEAKKTMADWAAKTDTATLNALGLNDTNSRNEIAANIVQAVSSKWYQYFVKFDPTPYLEKMYGAVFAINGEKDIQILPKENLAGIEAALKKSKARSSYTIKNYPGLNHLFQTCKICTLQEYGILEETISPVVLRDLNEWLDKNVK